MLSDELKRASVIGRLPAGSRVAAASDVEYFCPMHPNVVRGEPAICPICGMPLSRRKKGEVETLPPGVTARVALAPDYRPTEPLTDDEWPDTLR